MKVAGESRGDNLIILPLAGDRSIFAVEGVGRSTLRTRGAEERDFNDVGETLRHQGWVLRPPRLRLGDDTNRAIAHEPKNEPRCKKGDAAGLKLATFVDGRGGREPRGPSFDKAQAWRQSVPPDSQKRGRGDPRRVIGQAVLGWDGTEVVPKRKVGMGWEVFPIRHRGLATTQGVSGSERQTDHAKATESVVR